MVLYTIEPFFDKTKIKYIDKELSFKTHILEKKNKINIDNKYFIRYFTILPKKNLRYIFYGEYINRTITKNKLCIYDVINNNIIDNINIDNLNRPIFVFKDNNLLYNFKYKLITGFLYKNNSHKNFVNGIQLFGSNNLKNFTYIDKIIDEKYYTIKHKDVKYLHGDYSHHFETQSCIIFNNITNKYIFFGRYNSKKTIRKIAYATSNNLKNWSLLNKIKVNDINISNNIYTPFIYNYPNTEYIILIPNYFKKIKNNISYKTSSSPLLFSHINSMNFLKLSDNILNNNIGAEFSMNNIIDNNDEWEFYVKNIPENSLYKYILKKNRFISICNIFKKDLFLILEERILSDNKLHINFSTIENGYVKILILENDNIIYESNKLQGDYIDHIIYIDENILNKYINVKIILNNASIYSIGMYI